MRVVITKATGSYPAEPPFNPSKKYPEYRGEVSRSENPVYDAVRRSLILLGYDSKRVGTSDWNPLGHIIKPGNRVFIKPNLVGSEYRRSCPHNYSVYTTITHPSVVRAVADYVAIALDGEGEIVIGDNPSIDANFLALNKTTRYGLIPKVYSDIGIRCRLLDLRPFVCTDLNDYGFKSRMHPQRGDPEGATVINLGKKSAFYRLPSILYRGVYSKRWDTISHHHGSKHEYMISNTIFNSDVYISIPKMKTHRKVGVTLNLKGLVGINAEKNYLIHWRIGYPKLGGDEYPDPPRRRDYLLLIFRHLLNDLIPEQFYLKLSQWGRGTPLEDTFQTVKSPSGRRHRGAWEGNDSCWRMVVDLYQAFIEDVQRYRKSPIRTFSVIDGIIGGEGDGPFCPKQKEIRTIVSGENLLSVDLVTARLMDIDIRKIRYFVYLMKRLRVNPKRIEVISDCIDTTGFFNYDRLFSNFEPATDWSTLVQWKQRF